MGFLDAARRASKALAIFRHFTTERNGVHVLRYSTAYSLNAAKNRAEGYEIEVNGAEHLAEPGWIWSRHSHNKDIPDLSASVMGCTGSFPYFAARSTLAKTRFDFEQYSELGALFIDREKPTASQLKRVIDAAVEGNYVIIFPEGTRTYDRMRDFERGAAWMAYNASKKARGKDIPIYCVGIQRPYDIADAGRGVTINIAAPFYASDLDGMEKDEQIEAMRMGSVVVVAQLSSPDGPGIAKLSRKQVLEDIVLPLVRKKREASSAALSP